MTSKKILRKTRVSGRPTQKFISVVICVANRMISFMRIASRLPSLSLLNTIVATILMEVASLHGAVKVEMAREGKALMPLIISASASENVKKSATELVGLLRKITGADFQIETGDGQRGIVVGKASDFKKLPFAQTFESGAFHREDYVMRSEAQGLYLLGSSDLAVSHAVWDFLHHLGYRQFFPGPTWEVIPSETNLKVELNVAKSPDFSSRRIWYNWGTWGYNQLPYQQWCERNRATQGFRLNSGHAYGNIIAANAEQFAAHPEYFALIDGKRITTGGDLKFCISNPGLRKLVADYAVKVFKTNPDLDSISMDPSDGGNWCACEPCRKMGSVSDRALTLANEVARAINKLGLGEKYVGMYAYNEHSPPPSIQADPHVIVSVTTAFLHGGLSFDQILKGWKERGATMGVYDYLSVVAWDWNLPRGAKGGNLQAIADSLPRFHQQGARFYDAESGDCWGPCGLGYYLASRVMWDIDDAKKTDEIVEDFLEKSFLTAKKPMSEFYRLINQESSRRQPSDLIGRMYRSLAEARKATSDSRVQARLNDLILYTRYAELYYAASAGSAPVEQAARHAYRMRKSMMVHSYGLWCRLVSQEAALSESHPWKSEEPFTETEFVKILADGIANNQPVDPGFEDVAFSNKLLPAAPLQLPEVRKGSWPSAPQDQQRFFVWLEPKTPSLKLKVRVERRYANRMPKLSLFSPQAVDIKAVAETEDYKPDGQVRELTLPTKYDGLHRIETVDGGDNTFLEFPPGMPVTLESGIETSGVTSQFRGDWSLYFYVPKGTKVVGGWASRIANWAPRISGKMLDGAGKEVLDFGKIEEGWFKIPVAPGQDGKLWKFENSQGQRLLMTVPPYLARSAEELLLPAEVVEKDRSQ